ncbi:serpin B12-like isoform X3 [Malaya genurostris]|uniref:serpin B12-like isoform X3 n=1 Tax=Malaya genurostris TaxID=325434 RepID=UPI0026F3DB55|nr:serpin B12-like isoform X3 [Malaya genurostris]
MIGEFAKNISDAKKSESYFKWSLRFLPYAKIKSSHTISVANGVFVNPDLQLNSNYVNLTRNLYDGEILQLPFDQDPEGSAAAINRWVQAKTRGKIQDIISADQVDGMPMVLASALYFKAKWESMFSVPDTRPRSFYLNGREQPPVDVETMVASGCFPYYDAKDIDAKILGLPYQEGKSTMYILLPNDSDRRKLQSILTGSFNLQLFNQLIDRMQVRNGALSMPKMRLENMFELKQILISLGLRSIFDPSTSNLSGMSGGSDQSSIGGNPNRRRPTSAARPGPPQITTRNPILFPSNAPRAPPPDHAPAEQAPNRIVRFPVGLEECNSINNCVFNSTCNCDVNTRGAFDQWGCHQKPFFVASQCPSGSIKSITEASMCIIDSYDPFHELNFDRCTERNCYFISNTCYCCKYRSPSTTTVPTSEQVVPQSQSEQSPGTAQQQSESLPEPFEISNRFKPTTTKPPRQCQKYRRCDLYGRCDLVTVCALINEQNSYSPRTVRHKRQSGNNGKSNLYAGAIMHKVHLDVDEQGTEGGAVTLVAVDRISSSFTMRVDGPFLIYVRNDVTKLPLFYGAVYDPRS